MNKSLEIAIEAIRAEAAEAMRAKCYEIVEDQFFLNWRRGEPLDALNAILDNLRAIKDAQ
jgi:hypothetical protein